MDEVGYCSPPTNRPGRPKGSPNKIPPVVKEAILLAAEQAGAEYRPDRPFDGLVSYLEYGCDSTSCSVFGFTSARASLAVSRGRITQGSN